MNSNEIAEEVKNLDGPIHQLIELSANLKDYLEDHPMDITMHANNGRIIKAIDLLTSAENSV